MARGRAPVMRDKIIKWVKAHPEQEFTVADVIKSTKSAPAATRSTLNKARDEWLPGLRKVGTRAFFYDPAVTASTNGAEAAAPNGNGDAAKGNGSVKRGRKAKVALPATMTFKVVAELGEGKVLLRFKDDHFTLKPVEF